MPPPSPRRFGLALAMVGYLLTAAACVVGMAAVVVFWTLWVVLTAAYLAWTGRFREIRRRRWM